MPSICHRVIYDCLFVCLLVPAGPEFTSCPTDRVVELFVGEDETTVTWTEPEATSTSGQVTVTSSAAPGDVFRVGQTTVTYRALDVNGGVGMCTFIVTVTGNYTGWPPKKRNGILPITQVYNDWYQWMGYLLLRKMIPR